MSDELVDTTVVTLPPVLASASALALLRASLRPLLRGLPGLAAAFGVSGAAAPLSRALALAAAAAMTATAAGGGGACMHARGEHSCSVLHNEINNRKGRSGYGAQS